MICLIPVGIGPLKPATGEVQNRNFTEIKRELAEARLHRCTGFHYTRKTNEPRSRLNPEAMTKCKSQPIAAVEGSSRKF